MTIPRFTILLAVLMSARMVSAQTLTPLPCFADYANCDPVGMSSNGLIAGTAQETIATGVPSQSVFWAFQSGVWTPQLIAIPDPNSKGTAAYAINAKGWVAGFYPVGTYPSSTATIDHAYLWEPADGGVMIDLGTVGGYGSSARGINDNGLIVGYSDATTANRNTHAFVYDTNAASPTMVDLGGIAGYVLATADGISSNNLIVGYNTDSSFYYHPVLWQQESGAWVAHDLGIPTGGQLCFANSVSSAGFVVGGCIYTAGGENAFVWQFSNGTSTVTMLPELPGATKSSGAASAINDNNIIVGDSPDSNGVFHAVAWELVGGTWTIQDLGLYQGAADDAVMLDEANDFAGTTTGSVETPFTGTVSALDVTPANPTVAPMGSVTFAVSGGTSPYKWSMSSAPSGGSVDMSSGVYTAGSIGNVSDVVKVVDANGLSGAMRVSVGPALSLAPATVTLPPMGRQLFVASGGSGTVMTWSVTAGPGGGSGGSVTSGAYVAGPTGNTMDTVVAVDTLGNKATAAVTIGPGVSISPAQPAQVPPGGGAAFTAMGGSNTGWIWSLAPGGSGGMIDASGNYTAGHTGSTTDTVIVVDSLGNKASVSVTVGPGVSIMPQPTTMPPRGSVTFTASGGSGTGYVWSLMMPSPSGGQIGMMSGAYTAGATGDVVDEVLVTDSLGNTATFNVTVGPDVTIDPAMPMIPPMGHQTFTATGGSGTGFQWELTTNGSGGAIDQDAGTYIAGTLGGTTDVITVTDSLGNTATATITVTADLSINPPTPHVPPMGSVTFAAMGGSETGLQWSFVTNASGATLDMSTGAYTAGPTPDVSDVVKVTDSTGASATATVSVGAGVSITPPTATVAAGATQPFSASGGSGTGYQWKIAVNASGGSITEAGAYTAGTKGGVSDSIAATDSLGNVAQATVTVTTSTTETSTPPAKAKGGCATTPASGLALLALALRRRGRARALRT